MQNEFFGLKCGLFANLARLKALKCRLFQGFKQSLAQVERKFEGFRAKFRLKFSPKMSLARNTKACRLGFMGLGAGFSPRKVGLQGASSLSLSLSLSRLVSGLWGILKRKLCHTERSEVSQNQKEIFRLRLKMTNGGRFFANTHPQSRCAREGAFLGTSQVEFSKKFTHFLQGVDSSLRYAPLRMTSCLAILTAFLFAPNLAQAEQSGWFVGVQGGYNKLKWDRASDTSTSATTFSSSQEIYYACSSVNTNNGNAQIPNCQAAATAAGKTLASAAERTQIRTNILGIDASSTESTILAVRQTDGYKNSGYSTPNVYINNNFADAIDSVLSSYWYLNSTSGTQSTTTTSPVYTHATPLNDEFNGFMAGLLGGYKHFFGGSFGLRFYGLLDFGYYTAKNKSLERQLQSYSASFNADMLYNLLEKDDLAFGVFAGLSAGWMQYMKGSNRLGSSVSFGVNLGLRLNLSAHHSLELFSKINALGANSNFTENSVSQTTDTTTKSFAWLSTARYQKTVRAGSVTNNSKERIVDSFAPSAQVGLRYIYSF